MSGKVQCLIGETMEEYCAKCKISTLCKLLKMTTYQPSIAEAQHNIRKELLTEARKVKDQQQVKDLLQSFI